MKLLFFTKSTLLASGVAATIGSLRRFEVIVAGAEAESLRSAMDRIASDVVLVDFAPASDFPMFFDLRHELRARNVVLLVDGIAVEAAYQAMKLGVRGIFRKSDSIERIAAALEEAAAGQLCFEKSLTTRFLEATPVELTQRESELVPLIAQGLKNKEIATELGIAEATVRIYLSTLFRKLGVRDRYELAIYAMKNMAAIIRAPEARDSHGTERHGGQVRSMLMRATPEDFEPAGRTEIIRRAAG
jgi:DNA-binding NarL/FixJ family response regulator